MSDSLFKKLKPLVCDFIGNNEKILAQPSGNYIKTQMDEDRVEFLRQFVDLLLNTRFISNETKTYLKTRYITISSVYKELKENNPDLMFNTVKAKIFYDKNKIEAMFGREMLEEVIEYRDTNMASYFDKLYKVMAKYSNIKVLDNIVLKLPDAPIETKLEETDFHDFMEEIKPYLRTHIEEKSKGINAHAVGYIKYILTSSLINENDIERREEFLNLFENGHQ